MKQNATSPRINALKLRLVIALVVTQLIGIVGMYFLSKVIIDSLPGLGVERYQVYIVTYVAYSLLACLAIVLRALKSLETVEKFFSARKSGITLSNNLMKTSLVEQLIDDIIYQIPDESQKSNSQRTSTSATPVETGDLINDMPTGIIALDSDAKPILANKSAYDMLGAPLDDLMVLSKHLSGMRFSQSHNLAQWVAASKINKVHDLHNWSRVYCSIVVDGQPTTKIFDIVAKYQKDDRQAVSTIIVIIDKTDDYMADDDAIDFIAVAAHELRAPITVLRGLIDTLKTELSSTLTQDYLEILGRMTASAKKLTDFVNNILTIAHINQDSLDTTLKQENWSELITQICSGLQHQAEVHNQSISLEIEKNLPTVYADRIGIEHVLTNLVDNAIKYGHAGGRIVIASKMSNGLLETTVTDQGIGIPQSLMGNLFTKFYRSHRSKHSIAGTGIGLYLCKTIINAHGGEIWIKSSENQGTTVGFTLRTYQSVADNLKKGNNSIINQEEHDGIKNHSLYRR